MSRIKLAPDLLLGIPEFKKLDKSYRERGYLTLSKAIANNYGIVINDKLPGSLRLFPGSSGKISVKAGLAINKNHEYISVENDLVNAITVPNDSNEYFVSISYKETIEEKGTVTIGLDGAITGTGTEFLTIFRGLSSRLPSKIKFINSVNNISEYSISSVVSDELAYLNVVSGVLTAEISQKFAVVGTFTPSIVIDESNKYPFLNDAYEIKVSSVDPSDNELEFLLGSVINSSGVVTIVDSRDTNRFSSINSNVSKVNPIVGTEWVKFGSLNSSGLNNTIQIGWGLISNAGGWSIDSSGEITVGSLKGGIWQDISEFVDENLLVGWRVVFPDGKVSRILSVNISGSVAKILTTLTSSNLAGPLLIVPDCDDVQISIKSALDSNITRTVSFDSNMRSGTIEIESNSTIEISYRHLKSSVGNSPLSLVNTGPYIPESSFTPEGVQDSALLEISTGGILEIKRRTSTIVTILDAVLPIGGIIDFMLPEASVPSNWIICDGRQVLDELSILYGMTTPNFKGKVSVGLDDVDPDFQAIGQAGGVKEVTLTEAQIAAHKHHLSGDITGGTHQHNTAIMNSRNTGSSKSGAQLANQDDSGSPKNYITTVGEGGHTHTMNVDTDNAGGGTAHTNLQPYLVAYKIMRII